MAREIVYFAFREFHRMQSACILDMRNAIVTLFSCIVSKRGEDVDMETTLNEETQAPSFSEARSWRLSGKEFHVVASHWTESVKDWGENRWSVCAYIYPKHPFFSKFEGPIFWQENADELPFHGGADFFKRHYDEEGKVIYIEIGAHYDGVLDYSFSLCGPGDSDAPKVKDDALTLWQHLTFLFQNNDQPKP